MADVTGIIKLLTENISNSYGLYAFLGLIILIILYLIRPRPKKKTVPSLIFFFKELGKSKKESFLRQFMRDFLFIFHLILVLLFSTAAVSPTYISDESVINENTVLILDTSASSQTTYLGKKRIDEIKQEAFNHLDGKISIIILENEPIILMHDGDVVDAESLISQLKANDGVSRIGDAILAANNILQDKKGKIVVISDFVNTKGVDPFVAKKSLESDERFIRFIDIKKKANNIGIVGTEFTKDDALVSVKNFNDKEEKVKIKVNNEEIIRSIGPGIADQFVFKYSLGINTIELKYNDDFDLDNKVEFVVPQPETKKVLLITNDEKPNIKSVLYAYKETWNPNIIIETAEPPKIPVIQHDLVIIYNVNPKKMPGAIFSQIREHVRKGGSTAIMMQEDSIDVNYGEVLPVTLKSLAGQSQVTSLNTLSRITADVSFAKVEKHYQSELKEGIVIAESDNEDPLLVASDYGQGKIFYYGIIDSASAFKETISYPIFWQQLLDFLLDTGNVKDNNYIIGELLEFADKVSVQTPTRTIKTEKLSLSEQGVYTLENGRKVGVNLLNERESAVNAETLDLTKSVYDVSREDQLIRKRLINVIIYMILFFLFAELLYIKIRGDL